MMKSLTDCYKLSNGVEIPCVGFGTWKAENGEIAANAVKAAIAAGYRHIDTAAIYGNEESVGDGIHGSGVKREDLFITTKLWNSHHGYDEAMEAFDASMKRLRLDYLDLYLIHWPNPVAIRDRWQAANAGAWKAMEELYRAGKIRAIGVSNFRVHHLKTLEETQTVAPMANQMFLCPGETQPEVVAYSTKNGMLMQAYSPFGHGAVFSMPDLQGYADKYGKTIAQVCVRFSLQMGFNPLPKSVTAERIRENADVFDFELSCDDVEALAAMNGIFGTAPNPDDRTF